MSDNILSASSVWHWTGVSCPECPYLWEELHQSATLSPPSFLATWELFAWCSRLMVCWGSVVQLSDTPLSVSLVSFNVTLQPDIYSPYLIPYICYPLCETKNNNNKQTKPKKKTQINEKHFGERYVVVCLHWPFFLEPFASSTATYSLLPLWKLPSRHVCLITSCIGQ